MLRKNGTVLAAIAVFGFLLLVRAGAGWGIVILNIYGSATSCGSVGEISLSFGLLKAE